MNEKTYLELARLIKQRTNEQLLAWTPSSYSSTYQTAIGQGAATVSLDYSVQDQYDPDFPQPIAYLSILNSRGETIHSINCYTEEDENFPLISEIYQLAKDSYLKTNETIQSMFDQLNNPF